MVRFRFWGCTCILGSDAWDEPILYQHRTVGKLFGIAYSLCQTKVLPHVQVAQESGGASPPSVPAAQEAEPAIQQVDVIGVRDAILDQSPCMILAVSGDGSRVIYQNAKSIAYFGDLACGGAASPAVHDGQANRGFAALQELFSMQGLEDLQVNLEGSWGVGHAPVCIE